MRHRVRPRAIDVEEPDRLERQQRGVGDEIVERHAVQQPHASEEATQLARHDVVSVVGIVVDDDAGVVRCGLHRCGQDHI